jgi:hypothetical protein
MKEGDPYRIKADYKGEPAVMGRVGRFHGWGIPGVKMPILVFDDDPPPALPYTGPWPLYIAIPEEYLEPA